ncbi:MAG: hypothetical protein ABUS48_06345 [Pseudomonadota bacterium]
MAKPAGGRSLNLIRESGSTARVLNLALVLERFGDTEDYRAQPLLNSPTLNSALLLKHVVRPDERDLFDHPRALTLKIIIPFARSNLQLGGRSILYGERLFERAIKDICGSMDIGRIESDLDLLDLLHSLPSFDPFLMRERLRQSGYEPARCYFDLSAADVERMRAFVVGEISQLVELAFANGGGDARDLARRLADKLMTDETAKALDPLRVALQLSEEDYREGVFSWKGFLYYRWLASTLFPAVPAFKRELLSLRINGADPDARVQLGQLRAQLLTLFDAAIARVEGALLEYGEAFAGLASGDAGAFRAFLLRAPSMFIPIGEAIGVIQHIESFWRFRFPDGGRMQILQADEAFEIYGEFVATLGSLNLAADSTDHVLAA